MWTCNSIMLSFNLLYHMGLLQNTWQLIKNLTEIQYKSSKYQMRFWIRDVESMPKHPEAVLMAWWWPNTLLTCLYMSVHDALEHWCELSCLKYHCKSLLRDIVKDKNQDKCPFVNTPKQHKLKAWLMSFNNKKKKVENASFAHKHGKTAT